MASTPERPTTSPGVEGITVIVGGIRSETSPVAQCGAANRRRIEAALLTMFRVREFVAGRRQSACPSGHVLLERNGHLGDLMAQCCLNLLGNGNPWR